MGKSAKFIYLSFLAGMLLFPTFLHAASGTIEVEQPVGDSVPTPNPSSGGGQTVDRTAPKISGVSAAVQHGTATISWTTNEQTLAKLAWGRSQDYSEGIISAEQFSKTRSVELSGLESNSKYYFFMVVTDPFGNQSSYHGEFITLTAPDVTPPLNVTQFVASPYQDKISLSWQNPTEQDFDLVRIVRSDNFYPLDPFNGQVVYENSGYQFDDQEAVPGTVYFYSAFSRDLAGNYSSGALASALIVWYSESEQERPNQPETPLVDIQFPKARLAPPNPAAIDDFSFTYNRGSATADNRNLAVPSASPVHIEILKIYLPADTAFLTATVRYLDNSVPETTYLFVDDIAGNKFVLDLPPLGKEGDYTLTIKIFNSAKFELQEVSTLVKGIAPAMPIDNGLLEAKPIISPAAAAAIGVSAAGLLVIIVLVLVFL